MSDDDFLRNLLIIRAEERKRNSDFRQLIEGKMSAGEYVKRLRQEVRNRRRGEGHSGG